MLEAVRRAVKEFGKEAATHRFTLDEKKAIADIVYAYKRRNIKTSENEITRIGVNYILQDHKENGKHEHSRSGDQGIESMIPRYHDTMVGNHGYHGAIFVLTPTFSIAMFRKARA